MTVYAWKPEARVRIDAQAAGEEMERIKTRQNGRLNAPDLVREARAPDSALHSAFEWDDTKAAECWREDQASYLIRSIVTTIEKPTGEGVPVRAFVSVQRGNDRSYTSVEHAMSDATLRSQVLAQATRELVSWRNRYRELEELAELFTQIDWIEEQKKS